MLFLKLALLCKRCTTSCSTECGPPKWGNVSFLIAVAAIAVSSILVVLMTVVVVSSVVAAVCYVQKRQRRKRLILDTMCSNEQGVL